MLHILTY